MSKKKNPAAGPGTPFPLGSSAADGGFNFALFSRHADTVTLVLLDDTDTARAPRRYEFVLEPPRHRTGDIWHIHVAPLDRPVRYGYRVTGRTDPARALFFDSGRILLDPYCRRLCARPWGAESRYGSEPLCLASPPDDFDWQGDRPLRLPAAQTVIYELHVRGFTRHRSSRVSAPGTYRGLIDKIPYLKDLGITAVELLPVTEWDETDNKYSNPATGERLLNYWGYNPLSFFALKSGFAASPHDPVREFKTMVRALHQAGIEVILDMVFNHTGEIDLTGRTTSLRGIDNRIYYLHDPATGEYLNYSGCGNALSCNHPVVRDLIRQALHYWVDEMHVDGFRFDLAAIFSRDRDGSVLERPPLIDLLAEDPLLRDTKLIAEAWDAGGLYQVGSFSDDPRWHEWNGRYRDDVRRFMAGGADTVRNLATRIAGSSDLYENGRRTPLNSLNFITSHDGFTLYDLVSYEHKRNLANGEQNLDGEQHNLSWNSGCEGSDCPPAVELLRRRRIRSFVALLLLSQGIPMLTAGDEFGRTQRGNNNGWCQDSEDSWVDWSLADKNDDLHRFFRSCIALRQRHPVFRRTGFFPDEAARTGASPEIVWQSRQPGSQDWSAACRSLAFLLRGSATPEPHDDDFFVMVNGSRSDEALFVIPDLPAGSLRHRWYRIIDTTAPSPLDCTDIDRAPVCAPGTSVIVAPMGLIVLQSGD